MLRLYIKSLAIFILGCFLSNSAFSQVHPVYQEVDHILWVVKDLKSVKKGWANIGFNEIEDLKGAKLLSHGLKQSKKSVKVAKAHLGGANALWIQPGKDQTILTKHLANHGEGAIALIHKVNDEAQLSELISQLARANIGKIASYTLQTKSGDLNYTFMDTWENGKYYLGFVIDERTGDPALEGQNVLNMKFSQYAFAIKDAEPVSDFWVTAGLPALEITHGEIWDKAYFEQPANFDMNLGWQRHGKIVYEWCIPLAGPNVYADHIRIHGEGIQHFGFNVVDMDAAIDYFKKKGYKISMSGGWGEKGKKGSGRFAYVDLTKIGGMTIELLWSFKE
jgi:hypothetical protein